MIELNEPLILTNKQIIKVTSYNMTSTLTDLKNNKYSWSGNINIGIYDENNLLLKEEVIIISPENWNDFWTSFNSGKFLYQKYLPNITITDSVEQDFLNS